MAFSPQHSPAHSRQHSATSASSPRDRRASKSSIQTPLRSSFGQQDVLDFGSSTGPAGVGLANLADELADAFDQDEEDDDDNGDLDNGDPDDDLDNGEPDNGDPNDGYDYAENRLLDPPGVQLDAPTPQGPHGPQRGQECAVDSAVDVASASGEQQQQQQPKQQQQQSRGITLNPPSPPYRKPGSGSGGGGPAGGGGGGGTGPHRRKGSEYDGSEYGPDSDLESPGLTPSLVLKIDAVESLARRGLETNGGPTDGVFQRVADALRDIGSQSGVESSATRLITAHSALTSHLTHKIRQFHNLTLPIVSPLASPPDPDTIDAILPLLASLSDSMPRPTMTAFSSLTSLHALTTDLVQSLNTLADTLHMSRQTTASAMRRLKTTRDVVADIRKDDDLFDEATDFIERGNWGERLKNRECAAVCGEVVGGFEEVCNLWRARLLAQAESAPA